MSCARARSARPTWLLVTAVLIAVFGSGVITLAHSGELRDIDSARASGQFRIKRTEKCMMRKINDRRSRHGLRRLNWDAQLVHVARKHSTGMASSRSVYHDNYLGARVTHWRRLGQNSGAGGSCRSLLRNFMHSSTHRSNILGTWRHFGVGVERRDGKLYVQQIFESRLDPGNVYHYP